jgi:hypothetical protein
MLLAVQDSAFPIKMPLHYAMMTGKEYDHRGEGCTVTLATREIVFESDERLPVGRVVELLIDWPAKQDGNSLTLDVQGRTVEAHGQQTTVEVLRHLLRHATA